MYTYTELCTSSEFNKDTKKISNTVIGILCSCTRYYKYKSFGMTEFCHIGISHRNYNARYNAAHCREFIARNNSLIEQMFTLNN